MDNGSHRPESTLTLRKIALRLGVSLNIKVNPVSLLHSTKVPSEKLNGIKAEILEPYIKKQCEQGVQVVFDKWVPKLLLPPVKINNFGP